MTPGARAAAAIAVLDRILAGEPAEKTLISWARGSRYAGSGDRAAVRDLVYQALRCRRSFAALGGGLTGRGLILGGLRAAGQDPAHWFDGSPYAPEILTPEDAGRAPTEDEALNCPDWLQAPLRDALGADFAAVMQAMQHRAPVFLRVNPRRGAVADAVAQLQSDGITAVSHPLSRFALQVTEGERKIQTSQAYLSGLVEVQDASSQAVSDAVPLTVGQKVLDLCAGGGGKALALAARADVTLFAHDANPRRMTDLPDRARRAGVKIAVTDNPEKAAPYDVILTDVPCSGSGSWRRDPEGKWALTADRLAALCAVQADILDRAAGLCAADGTLAYATCSLLRAENEDQITAFLSRTPGWKQLARQRFSPMQGGDGFGLFLLRRS
ncbi:MAG: RsmB/NOP family class I SAM-dependent RNA methyltransferase [Paracoccaceae bacterium]